jgi:hypothetical protein
MNAWAEESRSGFNRKVTTKTFDEFAGKPDVDF